MAMGQGRRLTAEDWSRAALAALGEGGVSAIAVEPLAVRLGTTKGSFYWHFPNREALVDAALALWESVGTEEVIAAMEAETDPGTRLRKLFAFTVESAGRNPVEARLLANADHPQVAPVLRRVTARRVSYVTQLYRTLGFSPAEARRRALLAFCAYLGHLQVAHAVPELLPATPGSWRQYLDDALTALLARDDGSG
jgi:AcrR family transcriptional regulator